MLYDRETIFKLLQQRNWMALIELFKNNKIYDQLRQDDITRSILESQFIRELIDGSSFDKDPDYLFYLEQFHMLTQGLIYFGRTILQRSILESQFIRELIDGSSFDKDPDYLFYLEQFHMLHTGPNFHFVLPSSRCGTPCSKKIILGYRSTQSSVSFALCQEISESVYQY